MLSIFLFSLAGCSLFQTLQEDQLESLLVKTCLSGQGQSRIHFRQNRSLIRFESALLKEEGQWFVAMDVPGRGQEVIQVNYFDDQKPIQGRFYDRLYFSAEQENPEVLMWFEEFVKLLVFIPHLTDEAFLDQLKCQNNACLFHERKFYYEANQYGFTITSPTDHENIALVFEASDLEQSGDWFRRVIFRLRLTDRVGPAAHPAELYFFLEDCRRNL